MPDARRPRGRSILVAAALVLVAPVAAGAAPGAARADTAPATETVVGELVRAWPEHVDPRTAAARGNEGPLTWVKAGDGDSVRVPTGDVAGLPVGATVRVTVGGEVRDPATTEQGIEPARDVLKATVVDPPETPPTAPATAPYTDEVTVVLAQPPGTTPDSMTAAQLVAQVNGPVADFWESQSGGAIRLHATAATPEWVRTTAGCDSAFSFWAEVAASARVNFQRGAGKHLLVYVPGYPGQMSSCAYGLAEIGAARTSGGYLYVRAAETSVIAHELGHNFGLGHSSLRQCDGTVDSEPCGTTPYFDLYDVMGASWEDVGSLNVAQADLLGLLRPDQVREVTMTDPPAGPDLYPITHPTGIRAIRLAMPDGLDYWLEYRRAAGQDAWLAPGANGAGLRPGVLLHRSADDDDSSLLFDGTPSARATWDADLDEPLPVGRTVVVGGVYWITVTGVTDTMASLQVSPLSPISRYWQDSGGAGGRLGAAVGPETCGLREDGCRREFQHGTMWWSPATGAVSVGGDLLAGYLARGAENGFFGYPTDFPTSRTGDGGEGQQFQRGALYRSPTTGTHGVRAAIGSAWRAAGAETGRLGYPVTEELCGLRNGGCLQHFRGGSVYWSPGSGAHAVDGAIRTAWGQWGWEWGWLGYPTGDAVCGLRDGGCAQEFQGATVYWSPASGAHAIFGAIRATWGLAGWERGGLGYPVTDSLCGLRGGGCLQQFQGGSMYWSPASGAHAVTGGIRTAWGATGWEWGGLGYPVSDAWCGLRDGGCAQFFQGGSVYWSAASGAHVLTGGIRATWEASGREWGMLRYPVIDAWCGLRDGGCVQWFQGGAVYWSPMTAAQPLNGAILGTWAAGGWETGRLGYPTTWPVAVPGGVTQHFQGGSLTWSAATGRVTATYVQSFRVQPR